MDCNGELNEKHEKSVEQLDFGLKLQELHCIYPLIK